MSETTLTLPSFAKINWFLRVMGKRADDYHELSTAFQMVSLHDTISFKKSKSLTFVCDDSRIPTDENNLVLKAVAVLAGRFHPNQGADIRLEKKIPFPGGLGGGSSNAAITLLGLSCLWDLPVSHEELVEIAAEIGADVPYFLVGGTATGRGLGTEVLPVREIDEKYIIIVTPNVDISTSKAYSKLGAPRLTKKDAKSILQICYEDAERLESGQLELINDFEKEVFQMKPEIKRVKNKLLKFGAKKALMSGSGASIFALFDNENDRQIALGSFSDEDGVRKFAVETVSRQEYRKFLEPCEYLLPQSF